MQAKSFLSLDPPHLHLLVAEPSATCDWLWALQTSRKQVVARTARGEKAQTRSDLFNECGAALQLPYYFGENWNALRDCLADLEWLPGEAYLLLFTQSDRLLVKEPAELKTLCEVLDTVADEWSRPDLSSTEHSARPFHVVFQCTAEHTTELKTRLHQAGATPAELAIGDSFSKTEPRKKTKGNN